MVQLPVDQVKDPRPTERIPVVSEKISPWIQGKLTGIAVGWVANREWRCRAIIPRLIRWEIVVQLPSPITSPHHPCAKALTPRVLPASRARFGLGKAGSAVESWHLPAFVELKAGLKENFLCALDGNGIMLPLGVETETAVRRDVDGARGVISDEGRLAIRRVGCGGKISSREGFECAADCTKQAVRRNQTGGGKVIQERAEEESLQVVHEALPWPTGKSISMSEPVELVEAVLPLVTADDAAADAEGVLEG